MLGSASFAVALMAWISHANCAAVELPSTVVKRADNPQRDTVSIVPMFAVIANPDSLQYEKFGLTPSALLLEKDHEGGVIYEPYFTYVTQGGTTNGAVYAGVKPKSGMNVAVLASPASGAFHSSKKCAKLHEMYFGCTTTNVMPAANVPFRCVMTVEALNPGSDIPFASQQFSFAPVLQSSIGFPLTPVYSEMSRAVINLPSAYRYRVRADTTNDLTAVLAFVPEMIRPAAAVLLGSLGQFTTALLIDDLSYTLSDTGCVGP